MGQKLEDIRPRRVSLVKRGANLRRILLAKSEEENLDTTLVDVLSAPVAKEDALLEAVTETGGDESVLKTASMVARGLDALRDAYQGELPAELRKHMDAMLDDNGDDPDEQGDDDPDGDPDDDLAKALVEVRKAEEGVYKKDYSAAERRQLAARGKALEDGSYPIDDTEDLKNAITLARSGHGDVDAAKALIKRRAKALGAESALPDEWKVNKEDSMSETAQAVPVKKEDGSWDLSAVPEDSREALSAILKAQDDELAELRKSKQEADSKADQAIEIAKAERDARERREYIEKAAGLDNLAKSDEEIGDLLLAISKAERDQHLPEGTSEKLDELLKAANEAAAEVFKEAGRVGHGDSNTGVAKVEEIAKGLREKDPSLTKEQAFTKALELNPELYAETRKEA